MKFHEAGNSILLLRSVRVGKFHYLKLDRRFILDHPIPEPEQPTRRQIFERGMVDTLNTSTDFARRVTRSRDWVIGAVNVRSDKSSSWTVGSCVGGVELERLDRILAHIV